MQTSRSRWCSRRLIAESFIEHFTRAGNALSAVGAQLETQLQLADRRAAFGHGFSDMAIANGMTKANVHRGVTLLSLLRF
jgi:hypothetical protein